jgi:hypothetical protein
MSWILDEAEVILRSDNFSTTRVPHDATFAFEDDNVFGFVIEYADAVKLLSDWEVDQSKLLERFAPVLRNSGPKAWNVYTVMLTEGVATDKDATFALESIEENLRHTRKIPRQGVRTPADVKAALAPLLSIALQGNLAAESFEVRLARKLEAEIGVDAAKSFLGDGDEETVARLLGERAQ